MIQCLALEVCSEPGFRQRLQRSPYLTHLMLLRTHSPLQNWINNLKFDFTSFPGCGSCNVHLGFYEGYTGLSGQLATNLAALNANGATGVYFTGHSLGGALTNLATFEMALAGYPVAMMVGYARAVLAT